MNNVKTARLKDKITIAQ